MSKMVRRGFSIVELIVVTAIIVIMVLVIYPSVQNLREYTNLKAASAKVLDMTKLARSYSVAVKKYGSFFPSYGIYVNKVSNEIIIYADCIADDDNNKEITISDTFSYSSTLANCGSSLNNTIDKYNLGPNTFIQSITIEYPDVGGKKVQDETVAHILFLRPEPTIWVTDSNGVVKSTATVTITIATTNGSNTKKVKLLHTGQFYVQ
jgi:prepilin-type N-terminal cleavage/methylation domain-containing protein